MVNALVRETTQETSVEFYDHLMDMESEDLLTDAQTELIRNEVINETIDYIESEKKSIESIFEDMVDANTKYICESCHERV